MHMNIVYTYCAISNHLVHAFCTGELYSIPVSTKLLPLYTFLENILVEGKAKNKHCPVNERKSSYTKSDPVGPVGLNYIYSRK